MQTLLAKQALKELVDRFSILADDKNVAAQGPLFTEDGKVTTYIGGELFAQMHNRAEIVQVFSDFLQNFHKVYHHNGQFQVTELGEDHAQAVHYCHVVLVGKQGEQEIIHNHYVRYHDHYRKQGDQWLISERTAEFMISDSRELGQE